MIIPPPHPPRKCILGAHFLAALSIFFFLGTEVALFDLDAVAFPLVALIT